MNHIGMILPLVAVAALLLSGCINGRVIFLRPAGATHMPTIESTTDLQALSGRRLPRRLDVPCTLATSVPLALCHSRNPRTDPSCRPGCENAQGTKKGPS